MLILITKNGVWITGHDRLQEATEYMKEMKEQYESEVLTAHVVRFSENQESNGEVLSAMAHTYDNPDSIGTALQELINQAFELGKACR